MSPPALTNIKREQVRGALRNLGYGDKLARVVAIAMPDMDRPLGAIMRDAIGYAADPETIPPVPPDRAAGDDFDSTGRNVNPPKPRGGFVDPQPTEADPPRRVRAPIVDALMSRPTAPHRDERPAGYTRRAETAQARLDRRSSGGSLSFQTAAAASITGLCLAVAGIGLALIRRKAAASDDERGPKVDNPRPDQPTTKPSAPGAIVVTLPRPQPGLNVNLRAKPWGDVLATVKPGTPVEILGSEMAPEKDKPGKVRRWYKVRTTDITGATVVGVLHSDLLPGAP